MLQIFFKIFYFILMKLVDLVTNTKTYWIAFSFSRLLYSCYWLYLYGMSFFKQIINIFKFNHLFSFKIFFFLIFLLDSVGNISIFFFHKFNNKVYLSKKKNYFDQLARKNEIYSFFFYFKEYYIFNKINFLEKKNTDNYNC